MSTRSIVKQAGDTIVEVMIVVAILGLTFAMAYATANQSLVKARSAEEHGEALQYINSQIELLHNDATGDIYITTASGFCMNQATDTAVKATDPTFATVCTGVGIEKLFNITVTYKPNIAGSGSPQDDVFAITVNWPGVGSLGPQQERLYYKLHTS